MAGLSGEQPVQLIAIQNSYEILQPCPERTFMSGYVRFYGFHVRFVRLYLMTPMAPQKFHTVPDSENPAFSGMKAKSQRPQVFLNTWFHFMQEIIFIMENDKIINISDVMTAFQLFFYAVIPNPLAGCSIHPRRN